ncbi:hypothetical protein RB12873 [Rhodopirellula baltica SH 1]|uniref:Uncharacterized protein n=1 Tax=Rhodopirellula baltica (strain DSM 10527 / NCIMB 13988 / SH1) TaxID=243090 RepID=Q7UHY5_RHOBA|nr:hypothetical protein RB12873 [Rhodopirellula baltica SH 1]
MAIANCEMHFAMVSSVGQVPPGDGCLPVNVPSRWHINHASLCSKASARMPCVTWSTSGDCKLRNALCNRFQRRPGSTWRWTLAGERPLAMAYESRLALFQSIGMDAMCNMAYEWRLQIAKWT